MSDQRDWISVGHTADLPQGRVKTVTARTTSICLSHFDGQWAAMINHCPHHRGPLGKGSIERGEGGKCWIRCPWHGWDFDPLTGKPPGGHEDSGQDIYPVRIEGDDISVGLESEPAHDRTVSDLMAENMVNWGIKHVFGMVGTPILASADAIRMRVEAGEMKYIGIRHEGAAAFAAAAYGKLTGHPAACLTIAGPGATNLLTGMWDAKVDRAPVLALTGQVQTQVFGPGAFQDIDLASAFAAVSRFSQTVLSTSNHGELVSLAMKNALVEQDVAHLVFPVDLPIWAEIGAFCDAVTPKIKRPADAPDQISELADRWDIWRREKQTRRAEETPKGIHSVAIFEALARLAPADAIIAVDVGNNTYSFGRYFEINGQRVLMSGYLGSIGFGLPAAMGAWAATQDFEWLKGRNVISISGDGGFGQYAMELTTAMKYGMDIIHLLLHNGELGKISKEQRSGEWPVWETSLHNPSFAAFAKICGAHGENVVRSADIDAALQKKALDVDGPALVEFMTDADLV